MSLAQQQLQPMAFFQQSKSHLRQYEIAIMRRHRMSHSRECRKIQTRRPAITTNRICSFTIHFGEWRKVCIYFSSFWLPKFHGEIRDRFGLIRRSRFLRVFASSFFGRRQWPLIAVWRFDSSLHSVWPSPRE